MKRAERNPVKSRKEIIEKAAPLFNVRGYAGTSMQMIVEATGYQKGGIYRHFPSKHELTQAVFEYNFGLLKESYLLDLDQKVSAYDKLQKLLTNFLYLVANPALKGGCPIMNMAPEVDDTEPQLRSKVADALSEITTIVADIILQGKEEGTVAQELDVQKEADFIIGLAEGSIMMAKLRHDRHLIPDNCERLLKYIRQFIFINPPVKTQSP